MGEMIGMDAGEVRNLAGQLKTQSETLATVLTGVDNLTFQIGNHWDGSDQQEFIASWQRVHRGSLVRAQEAVSGLAQSAYNNASAQDVTSGASGGSPGSTVAGVWNPNGGTSAESQADRAAILQATNGKSPAEQQAWWASLSTSQRQEYLTYAPGVLMTVPGLASYMAVYKVQAASETEQQDEGSLTLDVFGMKATGGADDQVTLTRNEDGTATVTVGAGVYGAASKEVGGDGSGVSVNGKVEADGSRTYTFSSQAQAQSFYNKITSGNPDALQLYKNINAAEQAPSGTETSNTESVTGTVGVEAKAGDASAGGSASASGSAQFSYDSVSHTTTETLTVSGAAVGNLGTAGAHATSDVQMAVVSNAQGVQSVVIHGDYSVSATDGSDQNFVSAGHGGSFTMTIPNDPTTAVDLSRLQHDLVSGNPADVAADVQRLAAASTIVQQGDSTVSTTTGSSIGGPGFQLDNSSSTTNTQTTSLLIKPPDQTRALPFP